MKKRVFAIFLVLMLFPAIMAAAAYADGAPTICVSGSAEAERNDEITLTVDLENNPGICAFSLSLVYDSSRLSLVSLEHGEICGNELWTVNGPNATWVAFGDTDYDGTIMTARFKVLDSAPAGEAQVSVDFSKGDIGNFEEEEVDFSVAPATVTVAGTGGENATVPPGESTTSVQDNGTQKNGENYTTEAVTSTEKTEEQSGNASAGTEISENGAADDSREAEEAPRAEKQNAAASGGVSPRIVILIALVVMVVAAAAYMLLRKRK